MYREVWLCFGATYVLAAGLSLAAVLGYGMFIDIVFERWCRQLATILER
jgi:hypothetical protein